MLYTCSYSKNRETCITKCVKQKTLTGKLFSHEKNMMFRILIHYYNLYFISDNWLVNVILKQILKSISQVIN